MDTTHLALRSFLENTQQQQSNQQVQVEKSAAAPKALQVEPVGNGGVPLWPSGLMNYHLRDWMFKVCIGIEPFINGHF